MKRKDQPVPLVWSGVAFLGQGEGESRVGDGPTGGEPFWNVPKDLVIFFPVRGTPNWMLNKRLPGITARDVLPIVQFGDSSSAQRADKT
jgi:hypothetical protein